MAKDNSFETQDDVASFFRKFVDKGGNKLLIVAPPFFDRFTITTSLKDFVTQDFDELFANNDSPRNVKFEQVNQEAQIYFGEVDNLPELIPMLGEKLIVLCLSYDFELWQQYLNAISGNISENDKDQFLRCKEMNKSQYAIMYDELYQRVREGHNYRSEIPTLSTLVLHAKSKMSSIKENTVTEKRELQPEDTQIGSVSNEEINTVKEE